LIPYPENYKAGYIAIVGVPNVGKSTLMNQLLDCKVSIISPKPQTTRRKIMGIMNHHNMQIVFMDTPGIIKPGYNLQKAMMKELHLALFDADVIIFIIDLLNDPMDELYIEENINLLKINNQMNKPVILLLNKIDRFTKDQLLPVMEKYNEKYKFSSIIPISALTGDGLNILKDELACLIPFHPPYYDPDMISEHPERFFVSELIREQVFLQFGKEIPYSCEVIIDQFKERDKGKTYLSAIIYTERRSQRAILIGKNGRSLKEIGIKAREEIEKFLAKQVFLELRVKIAKDWRKNTRQLKRFGY
jgi:GTP-binding protein Era